MLSKFDATNEIARFLIDKRYGTNGFKNLSKVSRGKNRQKVKSFVSNVCWPKKYILSKSEVLDFLIVFRPRLKVSRLCDASKVTQYKINKLADEFISECLPRLRCENE